MPVSRVDTHMPRIIVDHMLNQVLHPAAEVEAQLVQGFSLDIGAMVIGHLRQGHSVESRHLRDLLKSHATTLSKLEVGYSFV